MAKPKDKDTAKKGNGRGSVYSLPNGRYRWPRHLGYNLEGKVNRISGIADNKTLADLAVAKVITDHARGLIGASEDITVKAYADKWL